MNRSGLYECIGCEYRVYRVENGDASGGCPECGGELKKRHIPRKDWLSE